MELTCQKWIRFRIQNFLKKVQMEQGINLGTFKSELATYTFNELLVFIQLSGTYLGVA